jgi:hypothetical protein
MRRWTTTIICDLCQRTAQRYVGHVNRARKLGAKLYCGLKCAHIGRRLNKSVAVKKAEKRLYDIEYRKKNLARIQKRKSEFFKKDYAANPEKYRIARRARQARHNEYCLRPEYRAKKHVYDRARYGRMKFGEYGECHVLMMAIKEAAVEKMSRYEIRLKNNLVNKAQRRKRNGKAKRRIFETETLGNASSS